MEKQEVTNGRSCLWLCLLAFGAAISGGCGGSDRPSINGTVTFAGAPLEKGYITFRPQSGTACQSAGTDILNGQYSTRPESGLLPGKFRVEITASRITDKKIRDPIRGMVPLEEQFIPVKYNAASQLEIDIPPESGRVTKNFDLAN